MSRVNPNLSLICPVPYKLDSTIGLCVEPTPGGFTYVNGKFLRNCPDGMKMNGLGVCIRPVMGRTSFLNENSIQQTTIALAGQKVDGGASIIYGSYDKSAYDMTFTNSVGLQSGVVQQIKLSDGSQGLFLVAQDKRVGQNSTSASVSGVGVQEFNGLTVATVNPKNVTNTTAPAVASASTSDEIPQASVLKMEYSSNNDGQMYFLGNPRSKIFLSNYSSSLYSNVGPTSDAPTDALFAFQNEAFSVAGLTDPYYVGSYSNLTLDGNGNLVEFSRGALQNGLDADMTQPYSQEPPVRPGPSGPSGPSGPLGEETCDPNTYVPARPADRPIASTDRQ